MESVVTLAYIDELLSDPTVDLVEVWDTVLYIRKKKGCGRNTFASKRGLEYQLNVYYTAGRFKELSLNYHPDTAIRKSKNQTELQQNILLSRQPLCDYARNRRAADAIRFVQTTKQFTQLASTRSAVRRNSLTRSIEQQLDSAGYNVSIKYDGDRRSNLRANESDSDDFIQDFIKKWEVGMAAKIAWRQKHRPWTIIEEHFAEDRL